MTTRTMRPGASTSSRRRARVKKALSELGHGQVPIGDATPAAVSFRRVTQRATVSFAQLRRVGLGEDFSDDADAAARALLVAMGLHAHTLAFRRGFALRSGAELRVSSSSTTWLGTTDEAVTPPRPGRDVGNFCSKRSSTPVRPACRSTDGTSNRSCSLRRRTSPRPSSRRGLLPRKTDAGNQHRVPARDLPSRPRRRRRYWSCRIGRVAPPRSLGCWRRSSQPTAWGTTAA